MAPDKDTEQDRKSPETEEPTVRAFSFGPKPEGEGTREAPASGRGYFYKSILEGIRDGISVLDEDLNIVFTNAVIEKWYAHNLPLVGKKCYQAYHNRQEPCEICPACQTLRDRQEHREIVPWVGPEGPRGWLEVFSFPWRGPWGGGLTGVVEYVRDITTQKKWEAEYFQAQKMEAVGTLAGGVAHDFNNLLMGLQGNVSLLLLDLDPTHPCSLRLKNMETIIQSGADLTRKLLGFARKGRYEVRPTDLNELLKKTSDLFGRTRKEIRVHHRLDEGIWTVEVDQGQVEQALLNLFLNAGQAMPAGGDLYLQTSNITLDENYIQPFNVIPGNYVRVSVTDTGVGMDEETRQRIFEPFFTTKEMVGRGTGLGLASVYGIVKNHGGLINVYSELNKGTTFTLYFPAVEYPAPVEKEKSVPLATGRETILLVDDEKLIIEVGQALLTSLGYRVLTAESGLEALKRYGEEQESVDLVILDLILPEMDGGEIFDRLRELNPQVKVLLSSGYSIDGQATQILERGCQGFIQKPYSLQELSLKIREILTSE
ncbi:MAG: response regulator [Deltaproteobacteria bacterium]|nr:response regulator [Deltaproteobacteria bacterium]